MYMVYSILAPFAMTSAPGRDSQSFRVAPSATLVCRLRTQFSTLTLLRQNFSESDELVHNSETHPSANCTWSISTELTTLTCLPMIQCAPTTLRLIVVRSPTREESPIRTSPPI